LRRPYVVAVAARPGDRRLEPARRFAAFLREPDTQEFISRFGTGKYDERPLLFPVKVPR
jgi:hypothetical protein